jgi:hypothetical protein
MADQGNVVPFGKYKGRLIEELLVDDPDYLQWLVAQDWFRAEYITLHQVIINRGAEPEETPEHNALQVLFLDDEFCLRLVRVIFPNIIDKMLDKTNNQREYLLKGIASQIRETEYRMGWHSAEKLAKDQAELEYLREKHARYSEPIRNIRFGFSRAFEKDGVDVTLQLNAFCLADEEISTTWVGWGDGYQPYGKIEIKPIVSDDYPAVLRQMRASQSTVLFLEEYRGKGGHAGAIHQDLRQRWHHRGVQGSNPTMIAGLSGAPPAARVLVAAFGEDATGPEFYASWIASEAGRDLTYCPNPGAECLV